MLGRTNQEYPNVWLRPQLGEPADLEPMLEALALADTVLDVTAMPGVMARIREKPLLYRGGTTITGGRTADHSADLMGAEIIEIVSSLGGQSLEFFVLRVREPLEDHQVEGALGALSSAVEEGLVRHLGLGFEGPAAMPLWQLNDAFDIVVVERNFRSEEAYRQVAPMASSRRVGVVTDKPVEWEFGMPLGQVLGDGAEVEESEVARLSAQHPVIVGCRMAEDVERFLDARAGVELTPEVLEAWDDKGRWEKLAFGNSAWVREAAQRKLR